MSVRRRDTVKQQWPRAESINERYYAMDNQPSFNQLDRHHSHFVDAEGRQYTVAVENRSVFQNKRLQLAESSEARRCKVNRYGDVELYVKLARHTEWFGAQSLGRPLLLQERISGTEHAVTLASAFKGLPQRRTGTITVQGLDEELCTRLVNPRLDMSVNNW